MMGNGCQEVHAKRGLEIWQQSEYRFSTMDCVGSFVHSRYRCIHILPALAFGNTCLGCKNSVTSSACELYM
jgi:hypothetical protein